MEGLYNVYAWQWKPNGGSTPAVRVKAGVPITEANFVVEAYLNRKDGTWDAYAVEQSDDPGWTPENEEVSKMLDKEEGKVTKQAFEPFVKSVSEYWGDRMPMMCMEELGELVQAISKCERKDKADECVENLIDEMGDVLISVWALAYHYGITRMDIGRRVNEKMSKQY